MKATIYRQDKERSKVPSREPRFDPTAQQVPENETPAQAALRKKREKEAARRR